MMVNIIQNGACSLAQMRSLVVRQVVYACIALIIVTGGLVAVRVYFQMFAPQGPPQHDVSSEALSKCRSEFEGLVRYNRSHVEGDRSRNRIRQALQILESAIPTEVWLTDLVVSDEGIDVVGMSRSESSVSTFVSAIASSGAVLHAKLASSRIAEGGQGDVREFHISGEFSERRVGSNE